MRLAVIGPREASMFACVCEAVVAPEPPLPAVSETDAVEAYDRYLAASPRLNRLVLRVLAFVLGARLRRLDAAGRGRALESAERSRLKPAVDLIEFVARLSYFGDDAVMRGLGYDPDANLRRARAAR